MIQKVSTRKSGDVLFKEEPAYQEKLKISNLKKRDLLSLCTKGHIPKEYHSFYEHLPSSEAVIDMVPEIEPYWRGTQAVRDQPGNGKKTTRFHQFHQSVRLQSELLHKVGKIRINNKREKCKYLSKFILSLSDNC